MKKLAADKVKVTGDIPSPRFGHTFTMVSSTKAVLFGGAVLLAGKICHYLGRFVITNETYVYDFPSSKWTKLAFRHDFVPA
jgi:protein phosphatase